MNAPDNRLHVLVLDDYPDSADTLALLLQMSSAVPMTTSVALDGQHAMQLAMAQPPQVALLDIEMPRVNGFDVAQRLRRMYGSQVCLIAMSARPQNATTAREGTIFDHALGKPVNVDMLLGLLEAGPLSEAAK